MINNKAVVTVEDLKKIYGNGTKAVDGVSMTIVPGKVNALLGPNGAGKSTTLKSILGFIGYEGEIEVFGKDIDTVRSRVSFVPEDKSFYDNLTPEKAIRLCKMLLENFDEVKAGKLIEEMDLPMKKKISTFSHGMKTSIYLAVAMSQNADLYIFDEPTWGLDPVKRDEVLNMIKDLTKNGKTVLYTSHIIPEVQKIADNISIMYRGRIRYSGDQKDIENNYRIFRLPVAGTGSTDKTNCLAVAKEDGYAEVLTRDDELKARLSKTEGITEIKCDIENFFNVLVRGCRNVL